MTHGLADARILIADDQEDVARTLCGPLRRAKAHLTFVSDGQAALDTLTAHPVDLILIDMKMPPGEWGGLWLLQQLQAADTRTPTLVLSGEGAKQQVIQALRLGATDWIDKTDADNELLGRASSILADQHRKALHTASEQLPTPIASRLAQYIRITDPDKQQNEGLHTLEAVLRLAAVIGLTSTPPFSLPGITIDRFLGPSMGTWLTICTALADHSGTSKSFQRLFNCLAPDKSTRTIVQQFVTIRNRLSHGSATPNRTDLEHLDALLRRFAHRAVSSGVGELAVPMSMTYDGERYAVEVLIFRGTGKPSPSTVSAKAPSINGTVLLVDEGVEPIPLTPLMVATTAEPAGTVHCLQFDGLNRLKGAKPGPTSPLKFIRTHAGEKGEGPHPSLTWPAVTAWAGPS